MSAPLAHPVNAGLWMIARRALLAAALIFAACSDDITDPPGTASISGVVQDTYGSPLAGAVIRANADGRSRQTVAAADGTFLFNELAPGPWQLIVDSSEDNQAESMIVQVAAGRTTTVTMVVHLRGVIRGIVRYNDSGQPAAGVQVRVVGNGVDRDTTTSADGSYTFKRVAAGMFSIEVQPVPSYRGETRSFSFDGTVLTVAGTLARVSGTMAGRVRSWTNGAGVGGVSVHLALEHDGPQYVAVTEANGGFSFPDVAVGTSTLTINTTSEHWAFPLVASLRAALFTTPDMWLLPRSTLRPIAVVRCGFWDAWNEVCMNSGISVINSDGSGARALVDDFAGEITGLSWSPDGRQLVFGAWSCDGEGCVYGLYFINADGSGLVPLAPSQELRVQSPAWSPDGSRILFSGSRDDTPSQLYVLDTDDNSISEVPNTRGATGGAWSPGGDRIAYSGAYDNTTGSAAIHVLNADGSGRVQLARGYHPTWSSDGHRIAFHASNGAGDTVIRIVDVATQSIADVGPGSCPVWSPDGSLLLAGGLQLLTVDGDVVGNIIPRDPGKLPQETPGYSCGYAWSPLP